MKISRIHTTIAVLLAAVLSVQCAKVRTGATYDDAKRYIEAWLQTHTNGNITDAEGVYVFDDEEVPGEGVLADTAGFLCINYTSRSLDGTISNSTLEEIARQMGTWHKHYPYGPEVIQLSDEAQTAGFEASFKGMKVGGKRTVLIPRWMDTYKRYKNLSDYLKNSSGEVDYIYELEVTGAFNDVIKWQIDSIQRFISSHKDVLGDLDSLKYGFYYKQMREPVDTSAFPSDTSIYVNYTGKLLNGTVFDTTDEKTAKDAGIYVSGRSYAPVKITWAKESTEIKMTTNSGSTKVVTGFSSALWQLRPMSAGTAIFVSSMGYGASGSAPLIPGYSPLIFEIEAVAEPKI